MSSCPFHTDKPSILHLTHLEWTDSEGDAQKIRTIDTMCSRWKDVGILIGMEYGLLEAIAEKRHLDGPLCCVDVLNHWLAFGSEEYAPSWKGLHALLKDAELSEVATILENAISCLNH